MRYALLDTNVYIGHWERGDYAADLTALRKTYLVRLSSVVLSELHRGARTRAAQRLLDTLVRISPVQWAPGASDWWEAGRLVRTIGDAEGWDPGKRRDFQNDALIALTARRHGAVVVTANRRDFDLLASALHIAVVHV